MASKNPPEKPDAVDAQRRRRPPATIDLAATEVHVEKNSPEQAAAPAPDPAPADPIPSEGTVAASSESVDVKNVPDVIEQPPMAAFYKGAETQDAPGAREQGFGSEPPDREPRFSEATAAEADASRGAGPPPSPPRGFPWAVAGASAGGGLVIAAILAALLSYAGVIGLRQSSQGAASESAFADRLAKLESQLAARNAAPASDVALRDIAARVSRIETVQAQPQPPATDAAMASRVNALETTVKSLGSGVAGLDGRTAEIASAARESRARDDALAKTVAGMKVVADQSNGVGRDDIDKLTERVASLEASTRAVEQKIETPGGTAADRDVRIAVFAAALRNTVERGAPFTAELGAIKPLASNPQAVAALEPFAVSGIPDGVALSGELTALVPAMRRTAASPTLHGGTFLDKLQASAGRLVRIRPVDEPAGNDPEVTVDRIESRAEHADIDGALNELGKLPPNVRAPADAWIAKAHRRQAALAAAQKISADALGALAKPAQ
jgi:hypothetical protein